MHVLNLRRIPLPQVTEHASQRPHTAQPPRTKTEKELVNHKYCETCRRILTLVSNSIHLNNFTVQFTGMEVRWLVHPPIHQSARLKNANNDHIQITTHMQCNTVVEILTKMPDSYRNSQCLIFALCLNEFAKIHFEI